ncbi:hypothetical protein EG833_03125 [archaeon]|nr:hypothetical protein [archaeon]
MQHFITIFCWDYLERIFPERLGKDHLCLKDGEEWLDGDLTDILGYSATVFISGTRFLIYPTALPRIEGRSRSGSRRPSYWRGA